MLRIGAVATLSRNFHVNFIRPLLQRDDVELMLQSGNLVDLLGRLRVHTLDLILSNRRVHASAEDPWRCRRIARQPVSLVGQPRPRRKALRFPEQLATVPLLLPGPDNDIRAGFDLLCEQYGVRYRLRAEVDDMALLRLLARDSDSVALVPTVVVQGWSARSRLREKLCHQAHRHEQPPGLGLQRHKAIVTIERRGGFVLGIDHHCHRCNLVGMGQASAQGIQKQMFPEPLTVG